jgi:hypothetical protein
LDESKVKIGTNIEEKGQPQGRPVGRTNRRAAAERNLREAQVIVAKTADHLPLHRQEKIFERHGVNISRKTMGGWLAQCADLLKPLYGSTKQVLFQSKVIGTDDTSVKVLDVKLPFARTGRIWTYSGDAAHPVILYDYTATRERAGPEKFLKGYRGYLQADAYSGYDAFFKDPARGLTQVGCWESYLRSQSFQILPDVNLSKNNTQSG